MRRAVAFGVVATAILLSTMFFAPVARAAPARVNGQGSSYVGIAMDHWVTNAQTLGLDVNYTQTNSPAGLSSFANGLIDFAGTEAEYSALTGGDGQTGRGHQYVPDVAGAIAVMYNVDDRAGRKIDYLHLSMRTIGRIFMGDITRWSDPAISADNKGLQLPDQPITVVYRSGQSGTTALFYDFIASVAPDIFRPWAARNNFPTNVRIVQLDSSPHFAPLTYPLGGSDLIAQHVAGNNGKWSIAYDEFGYAKTFGAPAAWVQNASGNWVLPFALNISAGLESATLRPDLSQELSGVYSSQNPLTYPISAYSYIVTQCAQAPDRNTCKGPYSNPGVTETLAKWLRYIACDGQISMAQLGYSPLPPNLSQEITNSIARMAGGAPEVLTPANCNNPRFHGSLGPGAESPPDPLANVPSLAGDGADVAATQDAGAAAAGDASLEAGGVRAVGGGSGKWRAARPVAYSRPGLAGIPLLPLLAFLGIIAAPVLVVTLLQRRRSV